MGHLIHDILYRVDWAAVSTVILTVITGYYAWNTRHMLRTGARQATAAERTLDILVEERQRQMDRHRAPLLSLVRSGNAALDRWAALDFDARKVTGDWPESRELELAELPTISAQMRTLHFPISEALLLVEKAIVHTRYALDEMITANTDEEFASRKATARSNLQELREAWVSAQAELASWQ